MQRARNRRRRHRERVDLEPQLAQKLLLAHAEALLLVDHDQPELFRDDIAREQAVGADQDLDLALVEGAQGLLDLRGVAHARDGLDAHREVAEAVAEGLQVLLHEQRGGSQDEHLTARDGDQEGRPHGHFGLAEPDVAADQPVHRLLAGEILEHLVDGAALVLGLRVGEGALEALEPALLVGIGLACARLAHRVEAQQLAGELVHRGAGARSQRVPGLAPELGEGGRAPVGADVARQLGQLVVRNEEAVLALELQVDVVPRDPADRLRVESEEAADAVLDVHDVIARPQIGRARERAAEATGHRCARRAAPEQLLRRDDGHTRLRPHHPAPQRRDGEQHSRLVRQRLPRGEQRRVDPPQRELRALGIAPVREGHDHAQARAHEPEQLGLGLADAATSERRALRLEPRVALQRIERADALEQLDHRRLAHVGTLARRARVARGGLGQAVAGGLERPAPAPQAQSTP